MGGCMEQHKITTCISTNNNLEYLKLAINSVRQNAYFKSQPIVVYAENCTDGTNEWLTDNANLLNLTYRIENNTIEKGIGGGMNNCVEMAQTEFVNIIHSDMWIAPNQDLELLKLYDNIDSNIRLIASSFRIQPKIFPNDPDYRPGTVFVPVDEFGAYYNDFNTNYFDTWAVEFCNSNDLIVRKAGGAGFFCRKSDYMYIGGNDPLFAPASWEDMDLFIRMQLEGYEFKMTSKSIVYHFSARGSHFRDEAKDLLNSKSARQITSEQVNIQKFINKWGQLPEHDSETFVMPINNKNVNTRLDFYKNI
jgi:GT2 family glycosyltransferase